MNTPPSQPTQQTPQSTTTVETVEWFDSLPDPATKPPKKNHTLVIVIGALSAVTIIMTVVALVIGGQSARCLTTNDLKSLLSVEELDAVSAPTLSFFSYPLEFLPATTTYNDSAMDETGSMFIERIRNWYSNRSDASIVITLSADYFAETEKQLAEQRISRVKADLVAAGIAAENIVTKQPFLNDPENDAELASTVTLAITSDVTCK